jgi:antitoxin component YwqK of YwqJK toxin-antitoxin module
MKLATLQFLIFMVVCGYATTAQQVFYFDAEGKKSSEQQAQFYMKRSGNDHLEGYYLNQKIFFTGSVIRFDTINYLNSLFKDSCVWYYKNGQQKAVKQFNQNGQLNGVAREYYESGALWKEYSYSNNTLEKYIYRIFRRWSTV